MKKLMIIVLMALSSSLVFAQAPGASRDPGKDPHKPSSAVSAPNHSTSADKATKPASAPKPDAGKPGKPGTPPPPSGHGAPGHGGPSSGHGYGHGPEHGPGHGAPAPGHGYGRPAPRPLPPASARPVPPAGRPVAYYELEETIRYMELLTFDSRKLSYAKSFVRGKALTASQIERMVREFSFDSNRLSLAKYAYRYCIDPGNYYKVERALTFISSKEELRSYIARYY